MKRISWLSALVYLPILVHGYLRYNVFPSTMTEHARRLLDYNDTDTERGIYMSIPDKEDPRHSNNRHLREFHAYRHLSRFEKAYRLQNGLPLHRDWDGIYSETEDRIRRQSNESRRLYYLGTSTDNYQSVPLSQGFGTHFANVWVGSPVPQRKTVIVDTGSHYTAFPCKGCKNCGEPHHTDPYFDASKSATFHQLQCDECRDGIICEDGQCKFTQAYTEGSSWEAIQVKDLFYLGGQDMIDAVEPKDQKYAIDFMFGCQKSVQGLFRTQLADGIMGLSAHQATMPKQLFDKKIIENNMFSICYRREIGTSRRGVLAGSMTIGGFSNSLDTSPMVWARNIARIGWYTVYVKNIFIRKGGGNSARAEDPRQRVIKVRIDRLKFNSGKGVIVDSGTTDTYLNKAIAPEFNKAWRQITGASYSHLPMRLSKEQIKTLPTILVQCLGYRGSGFADGLDLSQAGYVDDLDPAYPTDLLIAIPATSYMDYSQITQMYTSRLYFTETAGGVLGSNTMQGHNVVFDWGNGRVGFAESSCTYDHRDVPEAAIDDSFSDECKVRDPVLTKSCADSVDSRICKGDPSNIALLGKEHWTGLVESTGTTNGVTCEEGNTRKPEDETGLECNGEGLCEEIRECQLTCKELRVALNTTRLASKEAKKYNCGDSLWSACDRNCMQSRIKSEAYSDGQCREISRETRPCHIGACVRRNPCRVPFLIHLVTSLKDADISRWQPRTELAYSQALALAAKNMTGSLFFAAGDVNFLSATPSYSSNDPTDVSFENANYTGMKVVVEISMYNDQADAPVKPNSTDPQKSSLNALYQNFTELVNGSPARAKCDPGQLHSIAVRASRLKQDVLRSRQFFEKFIQELERLEVLNAKKSNYRSPFEKLFWSDKRKGQSRVDAVWTVLSEIDDEINLGGPPRPLWQRLLLVVQLILMISAIFSGLLNLWMYLLGLYDRLSIQIYGRLERSERKRDDIEMAPLTASPASPSEGASHSRTSQSSTVKRRGTSSLLM